MSSSKLMKDIANRQSPLVSVDQLEHLLGEPTLKIFDVRGTWSSPARALPEEYQQGHVPTASFLDWTKHFVDQDEMIGLASVADQAGAEKAFKALGINEGDMVVLYDNYHHMQAGRIWWAMRYWGFANVRVLNGGWDRWLSQDKPVSNEVETISRGKFKPTQKNNLRVSLDDFIKTHAAHCVIDARGPISYAGSAEDPSSGHIPNAFSVPFSKLLNDETGLFLDPDSLTKVFDDEAPQWRDTPIITSCGSGYAATVTLLALAELGYEGRLFDGSFSVWKQDPNRPIERPR